MAFWWELYEERLARELAALDALSKSYEILEAEKSKGIFAVRFVISLDGINFELIGRYPELFPYFPPQVFATPNTFKRHQAPGGHLCLTGRSTTQWDSDQTLIHLVLDRLPTIIKINSGLSDDEVRTLEEPQGEPVSEYFNLGAHRRSIAIYDESQLIAFGDATELFAQATATIDAVNPDDPHIRITVHQLTLDQRDLSQTHANFPKEGRRLSVPLMRLDPPPTGDFHQLINGLSEAEKSNLGLQTFNLSARNPFHVFGFVYKNEVQQFLYRDSISLFIAIFDRRRAKASSVQIKPVKTFSFSEDGLFARSPGLRLLPEKAVTVFGLGALGSAIAWELGRAGIGRLHLVDHDHVEPGTVTRWAFGWPAFGRSKAEFLANELEKNFPWIHPSAHKMKLGDLPDDPKEIGQLAEIVSLIERSDLIIDATAELAVNHAVSEYCRVLRKDLIVSNGTPGIWGGMVGSFFESEENHSCWTCMRSALYAENSIDLPPADPMGEIQPPGCGSRTFTGAGFDINEIALEVVRTSVGRLTGGLYPQPKLQLGVLNLRNEPENRHRPIWLEYAIPKRVGCICLVSS